MSKKTEWNKETILESYSDGSKLVSKIVKFGDFDCCIVEFPRDESTQRDFIACNGDIDTLKSNIPEGNIVLFVQKDKSKIHLAANGENGKASMITSFDSTLTNRGTYNNSSFEIGSFSNTVSNEVLHKGTNRRNQNPVVLIQKKDSSGWEKF